MSRRTSSAYMIPSLHFVSLASEFSDHRTLRLKSKRLEWFKLIFTWKYFYFRVEIWHTTIMADVWVTVLLSISSLTLTVLNSVCLYFIATTRSLHQPSTLAIANLLGCHLIQGLVVVPSYIVKRLEIKDRNISGPVCDTFRASYLTTNYISCLTILLISLDRMLAIQKPLKYRSKMTNNKICIAIIACWLYALTLCSLPFIPFGKPSRSGCTYLPQKEWTIAMLTINTLIPFIIIMYCYYLIFKTARRSRRLRPSLCEHTAQRSTRNTSNTASELNIAKISSIIVSAYLFCWGPSFVYYFLASTCPDCFSKTYEDSKLEQIITFLMKYFTFLNGIIAPIIYCLTHNGFKRRIRLSRASQIHPATEAVRRYGHAESPNRTRELQTDRRRSVNIRPTRLSSMFMARNSQPFVNTNSKLWFVDLAVFQKERDANQIGTEIYANSEFRMLTCSLLQKDESSMVHHSKWKDNV